MAEKKVARKKAGKKAEGAIAKPDSVEKHEGKPMPPVTERDVVSVEQSSLTLYGGPLPPSKEFVGYKKGHKDAPERILLVMEKEQEQRHKERNSDRDHDQKQDVADSHRKDKAQWMSFVLGVLIVGAATAVAIYADKGWLPALFGFIALPLLVDRYFERLLALLTKDKNEKK